MWKLLCVCIHCTSTHNGWLQNLRSMQLKIKMIPNLLKHSFLQRQRLVPKQFSVFGFQCLSAKPMDVYCLPLSLLPIWYQRTLTHCGICREEWGNSWSLLTPLHWRLIKHVHIHMRTHARTQRE